MSGHSKWSTIKRQKGLNDAKRGQTFTKVAKMITLSTRLGNSGDPNANPRLRLVLENAKTINMPKDNIARAVARGLGNLSGQTVDEVLYEGFGPDNVAFLVEGVTDNKNRTSAEIKNIFEKSGGNLGGTGSVLYLFDKKGQISVRSKGEESENELLELIELGIEEFEEYWDDGVNKFLINVKPNELNSMNTKITQLGFEVEAVDQIFKPIIVTDITDPEVIIRVLELAEKLEDHDDIQRVFANFNIPEGVAE